MLRHHDGAVSLAPVLEVMEGVKTGVDKTASELAIVRLQKEIVDLTSTKQNFASQNPVPVFQQWTILLIGAGILGIVAGIWGLFVKDSSVAACFLSFGFIFAGIGALITFVLYPDSKKHWNRDIAPQLTAFDTQIAEKQGELKHYRDMVALH